MVVDEQEGDLPDFVGLLLLCCSYRDRPPTNSRLVAVKGLLFLRSSALGIVTTKLDPSPMTLVNAMEPP